MENKQTNLSRAHGLDDDDDVTIKTVAANKHCVSRLL